MRKILKVALKNTLLSYLFVVLIEAVFYTVSFVFSGIVRRDIFNKLQGVDTLLDFNMVVLVVLATLTPLIINVIKQMNSYLVATSQQNISNNLKEYIYKVIYKIPMNNRINNNSSEIITRFRDDVGDIVNFFDEIYNQIPKLTLAVVELIIMLKISSFFSIISAFPLLIFIFVIANIQKKLVKNKELARKSTDESTEFLGDLFSSVEVIKLSDKTENFLEHYKDLSNSRAKYSIKDVFFQRLLMIFSSNLMYFALGVILFFTNNAIKSGTFSIGDFILYEYYFWFLADLPTVFSGIYSKYKQMNVAKRRINYYEELATESDINENKQKADGNIDGLEISWNNKKYIVKKNELCIISGNNASGKSFILRNIFANNNRYGELQWLVNNEYKDDIGVMPPEICYVSQKPCLITDTIKNNICMDLEYDEKKIFEILRAVDLFYEFEKGKLSLDTFVGNSGEQLSGGQIKRLALARLLYRNPKVILLDDITSGLDLMTEQKIIQSLKKLKDRIIIIASNSNELNKVADNVIVLG